MTVAIVVFGVIAFVGLVLDLLGRFTSFRCPTIGDVTRFVHHRPLGGWVLFAIWVVVGWHLLVT